MMMWDKWKRPKAGLTETAQQDWRGMLAAASLAATGGKRNDPALRAFRTFLLAQSADDFTALQDEIALIVSVAWSRSAMKLGGIKVERFLAEGPDYAVLFLSNRDGWVREAAVRALTVRDACPSVALMLLARCNDWVPQVRAVADPRFRAVLAALPADALAPVLRLLLGPALTWRRWDGAALRAGGVLDLPNVRRAVLNMLDHEVSGPLVRLCRRAMQFALFDSEWPRLAREARSGAVRAVALEAVLSGKVYWTEGRERVWVDRPMGLFRTRPLWKARELAKAEQVALLRQGAGDASPAVRRAVAEHMCRMGPMPELAEMVAALRGDKSPSVRLRMTYFDRAWPVR